ncbi:HAD-IA family hydrolase [Novosphingobium sp. Gsoil 351]|uniref:HAD-IA family hydrolase n=1 Tax=Novosphingobium sp. Gsoil 351 TaxID=2675225 RepID=UPI0012B4939B|nr:HAD-IA family hydrolase [Novosphingobium sp. Gsoil 351]QGN55287.1 HAD-IA family hydrolase [Novosphingobium sp. Gsoil 351]
MRLAVFDCDGTLVDGQADVCEAMDAAFAAQGLAAPDRHLTRRMVGLSLPEAMRKLLPLGDPAVHEGLAAHYRDAYRARRTAGVLDEPLFEGIAALLERLSAAGWLLGVATGKSDRGLAHCLATHGIAGHFVTLQTADRHPSKPHPAMLQAAMDSIGATAAETTMIGDTAYDIAMARAAGARAIGVAWGYHQPAELDAAGAHAVAPDAATLFDLLEMAP